VRYWFLRQGLRAPVQNIRKWHGTFASRVLEGRERFVALLNGGGGCWRRGCCGGWRRGLDEDGAGGGSGVSPGVGGDVVDGVGRRLARVDCDARDRDAVEEGLYAQRVALIVDRRAARRLDSNRWSLLSIPHRVAPARRSVLCSAQIGPGACTKNFIRVDEGTESPKVAQYGQYSQRGPIRQHCSTKVRRRVMIDTAQRSGFLTLPVRN